MLHKLLAKVRAWFTRNPDADLDTTEVTFEQSRDASYWARRDRFHRSHRPDPEREGFGPEGWRL